MSRAPRLLALLQSLRRRRAPVTAEVLAAELGVSLRTLYRDIATLKGEGASIAGEAGLGYVLGTGFFLPPLALDEEEIDAVMLGLRLVAAQGDPALAAAAMDSMAKIVAVLPPVAATAAAASPLLAGTSVVEEPHLPLLRRALRDEARLTFDYSDATGCSTRRIVWPLAVGFFERARVLAAWCELRGDFRHFRLDRITAVVPSGEPMPKRRRLLLAEWRAREGIGEGA